MDGGSRSVLSAPAEGTTWGEDENLDGLPDDWQLNGSRGIGLANTVARLHQLYDDDHQFDIRNRDGGGVEVVITMPLRLAL